MKHILRLSFLIAAALLLCTTVLAYAGTVAEAQFADTPPVMTADVVDDTWGEVAVRVDKDSPNTEYHIYKKGFTPEGPFDLYARWDNDYLYLCFVSPDDIPSGSDAYWKGDGYMIAMLAGDDVHYSEASEDSVLTYAWAIASNLEDVVTYGAAAKYDPTVAFKDGNMIAKIRVPMENLGFRKGEDKTDKTVAIRLVRVSSKGKEIEGWLAWGKFYEHDLIPTEEDTLAEGSNTILLVKKAEENTADIIPAVDEPQESTDPFDGAEKPSAWAMEEVGKAIEAGLVSDNLRSGYTSSVTRGAVAGMFVSLIEKATGTPIDTVLAEKGAEINPNAFSDTNDSSVLAANALGIINGTGNGKFSPDSHLKRAQIAAIINRVAKLLGVDVSGYTHSFTDIPSNYSWVNSELGWPVHAGIIKGTSETRFSPDGDLTTEQAILITYRALDALKK